jgi:hypothetical protein
MATTRTAAWIRQSVICLLDICLSRRTRPKGNLIGSLLRLGGKIDEGGGLPRGNTPPKKGIVNQTPISNDFIRFFLSAN